jgi:hypothetical protein
MTTITFNPGGSVVSNSGTALPLVPSNGNLGVLTATPTGAIGIDGTATRTIQTERNTAGAGNAMSVRAGGAASGATNAAGGDLILSPGVTTGTGRSWSRMQGYGMGTSGTSDNNTVNRMINGGISLANNTQTPVVDVLVASNGQSAGGIIDYNLQVTDGTNAQTQTGRLIYAGTLIGGTYTTQLTRQPAITIRPVGNLTVTWSIVTTAATKFTVRVRAVSTGLTTPTLNLYYNVHNTSGITTNPL